MAIVKILTASLMACEQHWAADLMVTFKELQHCYSVLLNHFLNNFFTEIIPICWIFKNFKPRKQKEES